MSVDPREELSYEENDRGRKTEIAVFDKNPLLAEMLGHRLSESGIFNCFSIDEFDSIAEFVHQKRAGLLIVDPAHLQLCADQDLCDFAKKVRHACKDTRLLAYSFKVSSGLVRGAIAAGFHGCVAKTSSFKQFEIALAAIFDGGVYFDPRFANELGPIYQNDEPADGLSDREKEVLVGIARGQSSKQIAYQLNISNKTVDTYRARAAQKLDLRGKEKLVSYVIEQGWMN